MPLDGAADRWDYEDTDYYSQPAALFRLMTPPQQQALFDNTARSIMDVPREIQLRHIDHCLKADPAYGKGIADALGIDLSAVNHK
ncbi:MAG: catalase-related domain-containing protein [Methylococcales bacterium]|nr:catalase-related domain-containing protein [Methylococcales bacterium]